MVKFGGHVEAIREGDLVDSQLYLIPYNEIKSLIRENKSMEKTNASMSNKKILDGNDFVYDGAEEKQAEDGRPNNEEIFINVWKAALKDANEDFNIARVEMWQQMFSVITANDDTDTANPLVRGANPGNAIKLYADLSHSKGDTEAQELLARMIQVIRAASTNSEALRKLVKKSDKHRKESQLSSKLLPLLYTSSLYSGQNMIEDSIDLLRGLISGEYDDTEPVVDRRSNALIRHNSELRHKELIGIRMMEFNWLKSLVRSVPSTELLPKLVAHRGFHSTNDRNDRRPVENSLSAYEMAWTCGIELCECDIALTKDEKLVLAHDDDFERLSLDTNSVNSKRKVGDLTFKEIISMPLTSGNRPPLLIDVLQSASAISERSKLIIEIKPGNEASAFALARLLIHHPDLRSSVAMVMSFDAATMHRLKAELDFGASMSSGWLGGPGSSRQLSSFPSRRNIGRSIAQRNLNHTPESNALKIQGHLDDHESQSIEASFEQHNRISLSHSMPKLMLLTVAEMPGMACELQVQYNELHRVDNWLVHNDGGLDGVYLQYEKEMMTPKGAAFLRQLSQRFLVGIWQYAGRDPDDFEYVEWLVKQGNCSFVNSDLPKHFRGDLSIQRDHLERVP